jgi:hypothetical protein
LDEDVEMGGKCMRIPHIVLAGKSKMSDKL